MKAGWQPLYDEDVEFIRAALQTPSRDDVLEEAAFKADRVAGLTDNREAAGLLIEVAEEIRALKSTKPEGE